MLTTTIFYGVGLGGLAWGLRMIEKVVAPVVDSVVGYAAAAGGHGREAAIEFLAATVFYGLFLVAIVIVARVEMLAIKRRQQRHRTTVRRARLAVADAERRLRELRAETAGLEAEHDREDDRQAQK